MFIDYLINSPSVVEEDQQFIYWSQSELSSSTYSQQADVIIDADTVLIFNRSVFMLFERLLSFLIFDQFLYFLLRLESTL